MPVIVILGITVSKLIDINNRYFNTCIVHMLGDYLEDWGHGGY